MIIHDIGQDFATKTHRGDICDIYLMTIMSMLSNYWEKYCYTVTTSSCLSVHRHIYILLYMYHDFTFNVVTVVITELSQ